MTDNGKKACDCPASVLTAEEVLYLLRPIVKAIPSQGEIDHKMRMAVLKHAPEMLDGKPARVREVFLHQLCAETGMVLAGNRLVEPGKKKRSE